MTKQELIQAWRDYETACNAAFTSEPFDVSEAFNNMMSAEIESTPAVTAGRLLVQHGDDAARVRLEDRSANGLSIADDEVYRLLSGADKPMNAEIMMLEDDIEDGTMRVSVHVPQAVKRIGIFKRGDFAAARCAVDEHGNIGSVLLQMDWYGGRDAFTSEEQEAFRAMFHDLSPIVHAG